MIEWIAMAVCVVVFFAGVFIVLVQRELDWQAENAEALAIERARFRQPLIEVLEDPGFLFGKPKYQLLQKYPVRWMGHEWEVAELTPTDGASVPRLLWSFTGYLPFGKDLGAAVGHDDLCDKQPYWSNWIDAANFFRHYQRLGRVRPAAIVAKYWAVIIFGPKWFRKSKPLRS